MTHHLLERRQHFARGMRKRIFRGRLGASEQPRGVFPQEESQRRHARGTHAMDLPIRDVVEGRVRRKAAPHHFARQAKLIEKLGAVVGDAAGQDLAFPGRGRDLVSLKLPDDLQNAIGTVQLGAGRGVLPTLQEAREIRRGDGLDLTAQAPDGQAMDARQQAAMAPLGCSAFWA